MHRIIQSTLLELADVIEDAGQEVFTQEMALLSNTTIGQHVRHTIELFQCLIDGYEEGCFSYDERKRNTTIAGNVAVAAQCLRTIAHTIERPNKELMSTYAFGEAKVEVEVATNYHRELIYNLEHCIHHNAIVRIALEDALGFALPDHFGVAPSTLQYRKQCAH